MILQNALDLAFDSKMQGFSIKGPILLYVAVVQLFFLCRNLLVSIIDLLRIHINAVATLSPFLIFMCYAFIVIGLIIYIYICI